MLYRSFFGNKNLLCHYSAWILNSDPMMFVLTRLNNSTWPLFKHYTAARSEKSMKTTCCVWLWHCTVVCIRSALLATQTSWSWSFQHHDASRSGAFGIMMPDAPASWCQSLRSDWHHDAGRSGIMMPITPERLASWCWKLRHHDVGASDIDAGFTVT